MSAIDPTYLPAGNFDRPDVLINVLQRLGFGVPQMISALAAAGKPVGNAGFQVGVGELDRRLADTTLKRHEKMALKVGLTRAGLLASDHPARSIGR